MINDSEEQVDPINDSEKQVDEISDSKKLVDVGSDPKSDPRSNPKVATYTNNRKFKRKSLIGRFFPKIIPVTISLIKEFVTDNVLGIQEILGLRQMVLLKVSVADLACSGACILRNLRKVSHKGRDRFKGISL